MKSLGKTSNRRESSFNRKTSLKAVVLLVFSIFVIGSLPGLKVGAAGTVSGRVFQDYNGNGTFDTANSAALPAIDAGVQNVTVTIYAANGLSKSTVTIAGGTWSINTAATPALPSGPYRVEFGNLPVNFQPSARSTDSVAGGTTTDAGSAVQFIGDGNNSNVNLAINVAEDYCQNNPTLCTAIFRPGNQTQGRATSISVPYTSPTANTNLATETQTGTVYGTAYQNSTRTIFQSAYMKRHAGFGPLGTGGIYKIAMSSGSPVVGNYVNLQTIGLNTGTDPRVTAGYTLPNTGATPHWDQAAYTEVGKRAVGDLDYDAGRNILWFINLNDRRLHGIQNVNPNVTPVNADLVRDSSNNLGFNVNTATPIVCTNGVLRPFGTEVYRGQVYVGAICTGESAGAVAANLVGYVLSLNPSNPGAGFTQVLSFPISYLRTKTNFGGDSPWNPWISSDSNRMVAGGGLAQPIISDLEFDKDGSIIVAVKDRWGDQYAANQYYPQVAQTPTTLVTEIYSFGDILRFCSSGGTFSNPGTAGCPNNPRPPGEDGVNSGGSQGPGGGEFYGGDWGPDDPDNFGESMHGALAILPGSNRVVATSLDPSAYFSNGFKWLSNTDGSKLSAYNTFVGSSLNTTNDFNKGNGLGDVELLCDRAPIEIGNRVWRDADNNGVQDPQESSVGSDAVSLAGITVRLYNPANSPGNELVGTAVTNLNGEYYFTSGTAADSDLTDNIGIINGGVLPNTTYQIRFDNPANFATGGVLAGLVPTRADATQQAGNDDESDSDAFRVTNPIGSPTTGTFPVIAHTTGAAGANNHTLDVGFASPVSIGSTVFNDLDNNGLFDGSDAGIGGVSVQLLYDANNDGVIDGVELTTALLTTTTSSVAGSIGNYFFGGLTPGNYQVRIPNAPATATVSSTTTATADNRIDNDDNGTQTGGAGGSTISPIINLTPGSEPLNAVETGQGGTQDDATTDANGDMTVDFGFTPSYSIGNRVWFDTNNDGQINAGEAGISGASVSVFASTNLTTALATMTTDTLGYYRFDNLIAGTYVVRVDPSNFANAAALAGYQNTTGNTAADLDSTATAGQNGEDGINPTGAANTIQTNGISGSVVTLGSLLEPINETDVQAAGQGTADNQANMTIDFGFYRMSLSGTVWSDNGAGGTAANVNNGLLDGTEAGIIGVRVQLYDAAGVEIPVGADGILGTSDDGANGMLTDVSGNYNFRGLPPGNYRVVTTPSGATSSVPTQADPNGNADNDDNGFPNTTEGFTGKVISGLIALTPAGEVTLSNASGSTFNPTVDFGYILAATVVQMEKFDAFTDGESVELQWSTGSEAGNLGFNVYREINGKRQMLNAAPIAGNALRSSVQLQASGGDYSWTDKQTVPNAVYYLEDLDVNGSATLHGAAVPQFRENLDRQPNALMFTDLANTESASGAKEIVAGGVQKSGRSTDKTAAATTAQQQLIAALGGAKITVKRDGWYRVSAGQLQAAGFDVNSNRQTWQLYADGAEVPFKLNSDSIEFFGRGANTALTDKQVYYLIKGQRDGLRINAFDGGAANENADARSFAVTVERQDRTIYVSAVLNGDEENWFGAIVGRSTPTVQNLNAVNVDENGQARLSLKLQGATAVEHRVSVRFNSVELGTVEFAGFENKQFEFDLPAAAVREGVNGVYLQSNGAGNDASLVDTLRLEYRRGYTATGDRLRFSVPAHQTVRVNGFTTADISLYEIRGGAARRQIVGRSENSPNGYGFSLGAANADREMIAVVNSTVEQVAAVEANTPSTWNKAENEADFVIVTANELRESADNLAAMRQEQGLKTKVVSVDDLFDEFTFGKPDPNAVKQFLKTAATKWRTKPNYALLFGDSSYDTRNNLGLSVTRNLVPTKSLDTTYMETASDSWLADFDDDGAEDLALGRLPVGSAAEAAAAVEKLARFDAQNAQRIKTDVLVADTGFESYSADLQTLLPRNVAAFRVDRSAGTDAETHQRIVERLNDNPLLVTYTGHGSAAVWASASVFSAGAAAGLTNRELSFYLLMNCLNGYTHQPTSNSLAEVLFRSPNGAIAVWASSGISEANNQAAISRSFTDLVFNAGRGKTLRLGDVVKAAKRASSDSDVRRTWQLIGDPTIFVK